MIKDITVPDIGDFTDVEIIEVHVQPGDSVKAEDPIITLESDKAAMDVPAPYDGVIGTLSVDVGGRVSEGSLIGTMDVSEAPAEEDEAEQTEPAGEDVPPVQFGSIDDAFDNPDEAPPESARSPQDTEFRDDEDMAPASQGESIALTVPDIGDFKDVEIIEIHVKAGDEVNAEDPLITLESDKAAMDVPAPAAGTIESIEIEVGGRVSEGDSIGVMTRGGADTGEPAASTTTKEPTPDTQAPAEPAETPAASQPAQSSDTAYSTSDSRPSGTPPTTLPPPLERSGMAIPHASPSVRRFARELGVDLTKVRGSGSKGRILKEDVKAWVKGKITQPIPSGEGGGFSLPAIPAIDFSKFGPVEHQSLSRIKKIAGKHLHACWLNVPHVTQHDDADITDMEAFRQANKDAAKAEGYSLTPLVFVMKAVVAALKKYPQFNASLDSSGEALILKRYYHIGIAVDTPGGLVVPAIRDVDKKGFMELAKELAETSKKARDGKLRPDDMQGASFSISSLGGIGGSYFTPIVNAPEVAILGLSKSEMKPVWNGKEFEPRLMLPLSLSYDHRVIDGAEGARFTTYLNHVLADIRRLML
ncbi:MAG: dihydrolipoyllysine-residue acetyltransferase [Gammaproteobacteria bacterium]